MKDQDHNDNNPMPAGAPQRAGASPSASSPPFSADHTATMIVEIDPEKRLLIFVSPTRGGHIANASMVKRNDITAISITTAKHNQ